MQLLVTGGAGFIGSNFVHHVLAATGHDVVVLDKLTYAGDPASLDGADPQRMRLVQGDICDSSYIIYYWDLYSRYSFHSQWHSDLVS